MARWERRAAARARVSWPATVQPFAGAPFTAEVVDVSTSGMRIRGSGPVVVGGAVTLSVGLPDQDGRLEVVARVMRQSADEIGVDFVGLPDTEARRVGSFVVPWEARRRAPRARVFQPAVLERNGLGTHPVTVVDLSVFGAQLASPRRLDPAERVCLRLDEADGQGQLRLPAIVWEGSPSRVVLMFLGVPEVDFVRLGAYVQRSLPPRA